LLKGLIILSRISVKLKYFTLCALHASTNGKTIEVATGFGKYFINATGEKR
jgi:hypothetical protein